MNNTHPLYFWSTNKIVFFVVVACACSFVIEDGVTGSARQIDLLLAQQFFACVMHAVRVTKAWFFLLLVVPVVVLVVCIGHADGKDSCHHCVELMTLDSYAGW